MALSAQGFITTRAVFGLDTEFLLVGPLSPGTILRRIRVFWSITAGATIGFGVALGRVSERTEVAYRGASALIGPSVQVLFDKPCVGVRVAAADQGWFDIPCGVEIHVGAQYVIGAMVSNIADSDLMLSMAVECLRAEEIVGA